MQLSQAVTFQSDPDPSEDPFHEAQISYPYIVGTDVYLTRRSTELADILTHDTAELVGSGPGGTTFTWRSRFQEDRPQPPPNLGTYFRRLVPAGSTETEISVQLHLSLSHQGVPPAEKGSLAYWLRAVDVAPPTIKKVELWQDGHGNVYVEAEVVDNCSLSTVSIVADGERNVGTVRGVCYGQMCALGHDLYGSGITGLGMAGVNTYTITAVDAAGNSSEFKLEHAASSSGTHGLGHFSTCCPAGSTGATGDPVNTMSGNFAYRAEDLTLPGPGATAIGVVRTYNSEAETTGPFGRAWTSPFTFYLELVDNLLLRGVKAYLPDGSTAIFRDQGDGTFLTASPGVEDTLTFSGGEYRLKRKTLDEYRFDSGGRLTRMIDPNGNTQTFRYQDGRVTRIESSAGRWIDLEYNGAGFVTTISAPEGVVLRYGYDRGLLTSFTDTRGQTWRYTYDEGDRLASVVTPRGHPSLRLRYGKGGRVVEQIQGATSSQSITYDMTGDTRTLTDAEGHRVIHRYDQLLRLISVTDARGYTETYGYDDENRRTSFRDKAEREWRYQFDERGNLLREEGPLGWTRTWEYNDLDKRVMERDALGRETRYEYDARGNLIAIRDALGFETTIDHDSRGLPTEVTDPNGHTQVRAYDEHANLVAQRDGTGAVTRYGYDGLGRRVREIKPSGAEYTLAYDRGSGLVAERRGPLGWALQYTHDANGNLETEVDANGGVTRFAYDDSDQRIRKVDPLGNATGWTYGPMGELLTHTDAEGRTVQYAYDANYRRILVRAADGSTTHTAYDPVGHPSLVADPEGRVTRHVRDALDRVVEAIRNEVPGAPDGDDVNVRWLSTYDLVGNLISVTNPRGTVTRYTYDARNQRTEEIRGAQPCTPSGSDVNVTTRYEYDAVGNLVRTVDPRGNATTHEYDAAGRRVKTVDPLGQATRQVYDANGNLTDSVDPEGRVTHRGYDVLDRLAEQIDNYQPSAPPSSDANVTTRFEYDLVGNLRRRIDPRGNATEYEYDAAHRPRAIIDPEGHVTRHEMDRVGNLVRRIDPNGHPTAIVFDALDRPVSTTDAGGHVTRLEYDRAGNVRRKLDARGAVTLHEYDGLNRLVRTVDALGGVTTSAYDRTGNLRARTDANGHLTSWTHDALDRVLSRTDAEGHTTRDEYDANGNRIARVDGNGHRRVYEYDALDRLEREINPEGEATVYRYDRAGNVRELVAPDGVTTRYHRDGVYRLSGVTLNHRPGMAPDAQVNVTYRYRHDAAGNLTAQIDPRGNVRSFAYDARNLRVVETDPLGNRWHTAYDPAGNRRMRTDARGRVTSYQYDPDDLLARVEYDDGRSVAFTYDPNHNRAGMVDALGATAFEHDALDRLTSVRDPFGRTMSYGYDAAGNRVAVRYPEGGVVSTSYFANDWVRSVRAPGGVEVEYQRDGAGRMVRAQHSNATYVEAAYDRADRLLALANRRDRGDTLSAYAYRYDRAGLRTEVVSTYGWRTPATVTETFRYDPLRRLIGVADSSGHQSSFAYDASSNRVRWIANDDLTTGRQRDGFDRSYQYDAADRLLRAGGTEYAYDANGNRIRSLRPGPQGPELQGVEYGYDHEDRLISAQAFQLPASGGRIDRERTELLHDGDGRRLVKVHDPRTGNGGARRTEYLFDGTDAVGLFDLRNGQREELYRGAGQQLLARRGFRSGSHGETYWYHHDGRGNVAGLTKHGGQSTHNYRYDAFGQLLPEEGNFTDPHNPQTFVGQEWDEALGLYEFDHRLYDPREGLWLTKDPLRGQPQRPLTLHRYSYGFASPVTYYDRRGLSAQTVPADPTQFNDCGDGQSLVDLLGTYGVSLSGFGYNTDEQFPLATEGFKYFQNAAAVLMGVRATAFALHDAYGGSSPEALFSAVFQDISFRVDGTGLSGTCMSDSTGTRCKDVEWGQNSQYSVQLVVHELGHVFNAVVTNAMDQVAYGEGTPYGMLYAGISHGELALTADGSLDSTIGFVQTGSQFDQYSQSDVDINNTSDRQVATREIFADMFLNWVFGTFPENDPGDIRQGWMDDNMDAWIGATAP